MTGEVRARLPEQVLAGIEAIAKDKAMPAQDRYVAIVIATFGAILFGSEHEIDGTKMQIPEVQWRRICATCITLNDDAIDNVNFGLSFMNSGPSSYKEELSDQPRA